VSYFGHADPTSRRLFEDILADEGEHAKPQRLVADIRKVMAADDIVLADTGAINMWMARLYPTYKPNTCLISNGLSTMAFSLPGAIAVKLAYPDRQVLAVMGDGSFLMNSQELETAMREKVPFVVCGRTFTNFEESVSR